MASPAHGVVSRPGRRRARLLPPSGPRPYLSVVHAVCYYVHMSTRLRRRPPVTGRLNLYVHAEDQELWERARRKADVLGVSLSSLVAQAMADWLENDERHG